VSEETPRLNCGQVGVSCAKDSVPSFDCCAALQSTEEALHAATAERAALRERVQLLERLGNEMSKELRETLKLYFPDVRYAVIDTCPPLEAWRAAVPPKASAPSTSS
jgi:hypothetical protein